MRFSHNVGSHESAGQCDCGGNLFTYPDYDTPFKSKDCSETFYLEAVQGECGVMVQCIKCGSYSRQPLQDWGVVDYYSSSSSSSSSS